MSSTRTISLSSLALMTGISMLRNVYDEGAVEPGSFRMSFPDQQNGKNQQFFFGRFPRLGNQRLSALFRPDSSFDISYWPFFEADQQLKKDRSSRSSRFCVNNCLELNPSRINSLLNIDILGPLGYETIITTENGTYHAFLGEFQQLMAGSLPHLSLPLNRQGLRLCVSPCTEEVTSPLQLWDRICNLHDLASKITRRAHHSRSVMLLCPMVEFSHLIELDFLKGLQVDGLPALSGVKQTISFTMGRKTDLSTRMIKVPQGLQPYPLNRAFLIYLAYEDQFPLFAAYAAPDSWEIL